jgi:hypothetical protein
MSRVALIRGYDRASNIVAALQAIADDIDLAGKQRIVVKPNFVSVSRPLSATHVDATRAVLAYLIARGARDITLAEGPSSGPGVLWLRPPDQRVRPSRGRSEPG